MIIISDNFFSEFISRIDENFSELDSAIVVALPEKDERYAELEMQKRELAGRFPMLEGWPEGEGSLSLSAEERAGLTEYLELAAQMEEIERLHIYYAGHRDCFLYLKKIGVFL